MEHPDDVLLILRSLRVHNLVWLIAGSACASAAVSLLLSLATLLVWLALYLLVATRLSADLQDERRGQLGALPRRDAGLMQPVRICLLNSPALQVPSACENTHGRPVESQTQRSSGQRQSQIFGRLVEVMVAALRVLTGYQPNCVAVHAAKEASIPKDTWSGRSQGAGLLQRSSQLQTHRSTGLRPAPSAGDRRVPDRQRNRIVAEIACCSPRARWCRRLGELGLQPCRRFRGLLRLPAPIGTGRHPGRRGTSSHPDEGNTLFVTDPDRDLDAVYRPCRNRASPSTRRDRLHAEDRSSQPDARATGRVEAFLGRSTTTTTAQNVCNRPGG